MRGRRARRRADEFPLPKHPYRDSILFYAVLSACLVGVAFVTGGEIVRAAVIGAAFFVIATAWSWWRFRERIAAARSRESR